MKPKHLSCIALREQIRTFGSRCVYDPRGYSCACEKFFAGYSDAMHPDSLIAGLSLFFHKYFPQGVDIFFEENSVNMIDPVVYQIIDYLVSDDAQYPLPGTFSNIYLHYIEQMISLLKYLGLDYQSVSYVYRLLLMEKEHVIIPDASHLYKYVTETAHDNGMYVYMLQAAHRWRSLYDNSSQLCNGDPQIWVPDMVSAHTLYAIALEHTGDISEAKKEIMAIRELINMYKYALDGQLRKHEEILRSTGAHISYVESAKDVKKCFPDPVLQILETDDTLLYIRALLDCGFNTDNLNLIERQEKLVKARNAIMRMLKAQTTSDFPRGIQISTDTVLNINRDSVQFVLKNCVPDTLYGLVAELFIYLARYYGACIISDSKNEYIAQPEERARYMRLVRNYLLMASTLYQMGDIQNRHAIIIDQYLTFVFQLIKRSVNRTNGLDEISREQELRILQRLEADGILDALLDLVSVFDGYIGNEHSYMVGDLAAALATVYSNLFDSSLGQVFIDLVRYAGLFHDFGKIGAPPSFWAKPDQLTSTQHVVKETHSLIGGKVLYDLGFTDIAEMVLNHHKHLRDPTHPLSYPKEEDVCIRGLDVLGGPSIGAQLLRIADMIHALLYDGRSYREPIERLEDFMNIIEDEYKKGIFTHTVYVSILNLFSDYYIHLIPGNPPFLKSLN